MKAIKNVLMSALLFVGATAFAQQPMRFGPQGQGALRQNPGRNVMGQLKLSPEQVAKLKKMDRDYDRKDSITFSDFRKQREQGQLDRVKGFKSQLNKDQLEQFDKMQNLRAEREIFNRGNRPQRMGMGGRPMNMRRFGQQGQRFQGQRFQGQRGQNQRFQGRRGQNQRFQGRNIQAQRFQGRNFQGQHFQGQRMQNQRRPGMAMNRQRQGRPDMNMQMRNQKQGRPRMEMNQSEKGKKAVHKQEVKKDQPKKG